LDASFDIAVGEIQVNKERRLLKGRYLSAKDMEEFKDYFQTNCFLFIFEAFAKENSLDEIFWVCLISSKAF